MNQRNLFLLCISMLIGMAYLGLPTTVQAKTDPVLMVISNQDFWHQGAAKVHRALQTHGLQVVVAADLEGLAADHVDTPLEDLRADDYSGIVFAGGWGMAQYQYGFEGTYHDSAYNKPAAASGVNQLLADFTRQGKQIGALGYAVSVLAWAQLDGRGLLEGRTVSGWAGTTPGFDLYGQRTPSGTLMLREQIEKQGATMVMSAALGDPQTATDDVWVDGNIITAENYDSTYAFAGYVADLLSYQQDQTATR